MKPLYTEEEFNKAKTKDKLWMECCCCGKPFLKLKRVIQRTMRNQDGFTGEFCSKKCRAQPHKKQKKIIDPPIKCENPKCNIEHNGSFGSGRFCSRNCANGRPKTEKDKLKISEGVSNSEKFSKGIVIGHEKLRQGRKDGKYKSRKKRIEWKCPVCSCILNIKPHEAKRKKYCSGTCRNYINNKYQNGNRSYAERYLEEILNKSFPNLEIIFNSRKILKNNKELDVYIPSLKFAIEWNGIYHYSEIKNRNLQYTQKKDDEKKIECKNKGISILIIKDLTSNKKFIKQETEKIVCIIHGLIHWRDSRTPNPMPE